MNRIVLKNAAQSVTFQVVTGVGSFAFALISAMVLAPDLRGDLAAYSAAVLIASVAAMLGLPQALIYFAPNGLASASSIARFRRMVAIAVVLASLATISYLSWSGFGLNVVLCATVVVFGIVASVEAATSQWLLMGLGRFTPVTVARCVSTAVLLLGVLGMLAWRKVSDSTSLLAFVVLSVVALGIQALMQWWVAWPAAREMESSHAYTELRSYAFRAYPGTLLQTCISRLDVLILAVVAPAGEVGIYAVALGLADSLMMLPQAVSSVLLPELARDGGEGLRRLRRLLGGWLGLQALATVIFIAAAAVICPLVLSDSYDGVVTVAAILAMGNLALGAARIGSSALSGLNRPGAASALAGLVVLVMVPLVALFGHAGGATGAAIGSAVAYLVGLLATIPLVANLRTRGADAHSAV